MEESENISTGAQVDTWGYRRVNESTRVQRGLPCQWTGTPDAIQRQKQRQKHHTYSTDMGGGKCIPLRGRTRDMD